MRKVLSLMLVFAMVLTLASFPAFATSQVVAGTIPWGDDYMQANSWDYSPWLDNNEETGDGTYHLWTNDVATAPFVDGEGNPLGNYFELDLGAEYDVESVVIKWGNYSAGWGYTAPIAYSISYAGEDRVYGEATSYTDLHQKYVDDTLPANLVASTNVDYKDTALINLDATETNVGTVRYVKVELNAYQYKAYIRDIVVTVDDGAGSEPETPSLSGAIAYKGANIRLASGELSAGLRFGATLSKEAIGIEGRTWFHGIDGVEVGMFLLPVEMLGEGESLIDYLENGGAEALKITALKGLSQDSATLTYTAVLTGIPEDSYNWEIAAAPYVLVDGEYTYYEAANKSYAQVAQAAIESYNNGNPNGITPEQLTALEEIVDIANGVTPDPDEPGDEPTLTEQKVALTADSITVQRYFPSTDWAGPDADLNTPEARALFVDGSIDTYVCSGVWGSGDILEQQGFYYQVIVDLGAEKNLSKINFHVGAENYGNGWQYAAPLDAEISVAGNSGEYTSVYTYEAAENEDYRLDTVTLDHTTEGANVRYIKYKFQVINANPTLAEIEVYEMAESTGNEGGNEPGTEPEEPGDEGGELEIPTGDPVSVTLSAESITAPTGGTGDLANLLDGDEATGYLMAYNYSWSGDSDPLTSNNEFVIDLGAMYYNPTLTLNWGGQGTHGWGWTAPGDYTVYYVGEDGVYTVAAEYTDLFTNTANSTLPAGLTASRTYADEYILTAVTSIPANGVRYIKIVMTSFRNNGIALNDISVTGVPVTTGGGAGEDPAPSLEYYNIDAAASAQGLNYEGAVLPASLFVDLNTTYAGYEINGSYKVDAETLLMLTTVDCIGDGTIAYKDYREFASYIATVESSWGQNDNEGYGSDNYGEQITSAPVSKLSDPVYMSMVLASEAPTYQNKDNKPEEHQNNGVNMHAPSTDTVFDRINALGAIYVNKDLKSELEANYKNEQVTVCIGNIKLLIRTADGWIQRTVAVPSAGFGMLYALPWQLEWELGSDQYASQLCVNIDNSITQYANYSAIKMDVADFLENKSGHWWTGSTSFDERTFHFWGNIHTLSELGISEDTEVLGVIASYEVWVEEEELAPYFVASVGADWRLESGATRQAFAGHQIVTTTNKQILFGHSFGAEDYETYVASDLDNVKAMLGIQ